MSRIEQAIEKATLLREGLNTGRADEELDRGRQASRQGLENPLPPPAETAVPQLDNPLIVTANDPHSPVSEEYRKLKSCLVNLTRGETFRNVIMVTSSLSGEGKSITSLNLAITLAQEYDHTVMLVDADLRKPSLHGYLGLEVGKGLTDCLCGEADIPDVLIKTGIGKLSLLTAGTPKKNPVELLSSQRMREFLAEIKNRYSDRYIIIDSPPVLPVAEARALASLADGVVFVIKEGLPTLHDISEAVGAVNRESILGVVYNEATPEGLNGRYHSYYHGYSYGYGGGKETSDQIPGSRYRRLSNDGERKGFLSRIFRRSGGERL